MSEPLNLEQALEKKRARRLNLLGVRYIRIVKELDGAPRGTAVLDDGTTVFGYPRIGRILSLDQGLERQFEAPFWMEEKIDGYNVRIFRHQNRLLALSRGGFLCPFSVDRVPELIDPALFEAEPGLVLCAEIAGPGNPYLENSPPFIDEDIRLFVFDMMRLGSAGFLPHEEKRTLVERFTLPTPICYGRYTGGDADEIREIMLQLNAEGREGVVFKEDTPRDHRAKYVTSNSSVQDISAAAASLLELPPEYFTNRLLRLALFLHQEELDTSPELNRRTGAAFLEGLTQAVAGFERDGKVAHRFTCRFREKEAAEGFVKHLKRVSGPRVNLAQRGLSREGDYWVLEFERIFQTMTGTLENLLGGGLVFD